MDFSKALGLLNRGKKVRRKKFEKNAFFFINKNTGYIDFNCPWNEALCYHCNYLFDSEDVFADDWEEVKGDYHERIDSFPKLKEAWEKYKTDDEK